MTLTKEKNAPVKIPVKIKNSPEELLALRKELSGRLQHVREQAREVTASYLANLERDILEITDRLNEGGAKKGGKQPVRGRQLKAILRTFEQLSLKPEKGRRKDLKRIEKVVDKALTAMNQAGEGPKGTLR